MAKGPSKNRDNSDPGQPVGCRVASPGAAAGSQRRSSVPQNDTSIPADRAEAPPAPHQGGRLNEVILRLAGLIGRQIAREELDRTRSSKP